MHSRQRQQQGRSRRQRDNRLRRDSPRLASRKIREQVQRMADGFFVNFCGLQEMSEKEKRKKFGDMDIVMTGFAGLSGSAILACEKYDQLRSRYPASFLEGAKNRKRFLGQIPEAAPAGKSDDCSAYSFSEKGITGMYLLSEGGVFAGLWNLAKAAGVGLKIDLKSIPIRQETVEICNFFDVNPYQMQSEGSCLLLADNGGRVKAGLQEKGIFSEIIGVTTENNDRVVINGEERRYLEKHYEDALELVSRKEQS